MPLQLAILTEDEETGTASNLPIEPLSSTEAVLERVRLTFAIGRIASRKLFKCIGSGGPRCFQQGALELTPSQMWLTRVRSQLFVRCLTSRTTFFYSQATTRSRFRLRRCVYISSDAPALCAALHLFSKPA